jgi:hypothetical protein
VREAAELVSLGLGEGARLTIRDLVARSELGDQLRSTPRLIDLDAGVQLYVERFFVEGASEAGIVLPWPSMQSFRDGTVRNAPVGVSVRVLEGRAPPTDFGPIFEHIRVEATDQRFQVLR